MNNTPNTPLPPNVSSKIESPSQTMLVDLRSFRLDEAAMYTWARSSSSEGREIFRLIVPEDFCHDFASVPRLLWILVSPLDLGLASIFHDWLYIHKGKVETLCWDTTENIWKPIDKEWSRFDTDRLFSRIMREQNVVKWRRRLAFRAVHWFGKKHWGGPAIEMPGATQNKEPERVEQVEQAV